MTDRPDDGPKSDALYCSSCRESFDTPGPSFPPYAAMHTATGHVHPITGKPLSNPPEVGHEDA